MKYIAIAASLTVSTLAHAQADTTPNLPISLKNIAGKWSCASVGIDQTGLGMTVSSTYKTTISDKGVEQAPEMTMAFRTKSMTDADVSTYQLKSNATGLYTLDNGQLSAQNISGNVTDVKHISGVEIIPAANFKKQTQTGVTQETREKVKTKINTSQLTPSKWAFSMNKGKMDFSFTCTKP